MTATIAQADWLAEARRRFGDDPMDWAFVCPTCGDVATGADMKAALAGRGDDRDASAVLGQVCIGRLLGALSMPADQWTGRGCDWCAFGLFGGPVGVELPDGKILSAFKFAGV